MHAYNPNGDVLSYVTLSGGNQVVTRSSSQPWVRFLLVCFSWRTCSYSAQIWIGMFFNICMIY